MRACIVCALSNVSPLFLSTPKSRAIHKQSLSPKRQKRQKRQKRRATLSPGRCLSSACRTVTITFSGYSKNEFAHSQSSARTYNCQQVASGHCSWKLHICAPPAGRGCSILKDTVTQANWSVCARCEQVDCSWSMHLTQTHVSRRLLFPFSLSCGHFPFNHPHHNNILAIVVVQ